MEIRRIRFDGGVLVLVSVLATVSVVGLACRPSRPVPATAVVAPATPSRCTETADACVARAADLAGHGQPAEAAKILQQVCHVDGEPLGCSALARFYLDQRYGEPDPRASGEAGRRGILGWIQRCEADDRDACVRLGADLDDLAHDPASAFAAYDVACNYGQADGCAEAGTFAQDGAGVPRDRGLAIERYRRGCQLSSATACFYLGLVLSDGQGAAPAIDEQGAVVAFTTGCELRDLRACNNLGLALGNGRGAPRDPAAALEIYIAACEAGHTLACHNAGSNLQRGEGAALDLTRAYGFYKRACDGGAGDDCHQQASFLEHGWGVAVDKRAALATYQRACALDDGRGCTAAGSLLSFGLAEPSDLVGAHHAYQRACKLHDLDGCDELAGAYLHGRGVAEDRLKGIVRYLAACARGRMASCEHAAMAIVATDHAAAVEYFTTYCYRDDPGFRGPCRMIVAISLGWLGDATDPDRALLASERICLGPVQPDESPDKSIPSCEHALRTLDAQPPSPAGKRRRQLLVTALAALRASALTP